MGFRYLLDFGCFGSLRILWVGFDGIGSNSWFSLVQFGAVEIHLLDFDIAIEVGI